MKNTPAELLLELQSQKTHLTNCILTVLPQEFTAGFCANIIQSGIFLLWSPCRQAQPGGEEARDVTAGTIPSLPITVTLPLGTELNFLAIDYTVGDVSKAFHCWVWALSLLQQRKAIKFPEGRWGGVTEHRPLKITPAQSLQQNKSGIIHATLQWMSHLLPLILLIIADSLLVIVSENTWKISRKVWSNLKAQRFLSIFSFPKHRHCFSKKEISLQSVNLFILYVFLSWNSSFNLCYSAWAMQQLIISVCKKSIPTKHRCHLTTYPYIFLEQIIIRGEQEAELL